MNESKAKTAEEIVGHFVDALLPLFPAPVQTTNAEGNIVSPSRVPEGVQANLLLAVQKLLDAKN